MIQPTKILPIFEEQMALPRVKLLTANQVAGSDVNVQDLIGASRSRSEEENKYREPPAFQAFLRCECGLVNQSELWQPLPILIIRRLRSNRHYSYCSHFETSFQSTEHMLRLVLPPWLWNRGFKLYLHTTVNAGSKGGQLTPSRVNSAAFGAIQKAAERMITYGARSNADTLQDLHLTLRLLFENSTASPCDETLHGVTLLHVSVYNLQYRADFYKNTETADVFRWQPILHT